MAQMRIISAERTLQRIRPLLRPGFPLFHPDVHVLILHPFFGPTTGNQRHHWSSALAVGDFAAVSTRLSAPKKLNRLLTNGTAAKYGRADRHLALLLINEV